MTSLRVVVVLLLAVDTGIAAVCAKPDCLPTNLCSTLSYGIQRFHPKMGGCFGEKVWNARATLCAAGTHVCSGAEVILYKGEQDFAFHYWIDDALSASFEFGDCFAYLHNTGLSPACVDTGGNFVSLVVRGPTSLDDCGNSVTSSYQNCSFDAGPAALNGIGGCPISTKAEASTLCCANAMGEIGGISSTFPANNADLISPSLSTFVANFNKNFLSHCDAGFKIKCNGQPVAFSSECTVTESSQCAQLTFTFATSTNLPSGAKCEFEMDGSYVVSVDLLAYQDYHSVFYTTPIPCSGCAFATLQYAGLGTCACAGELTTQSGSFTGCHLGWVPCTADMFRWRYDTTKSLREPFYHLWLNQFRGYAGTGSCVGETGAVPVIFVCAQGVNFDSADVDPKGRSCTKRGCQFDAASPVIDTLGLPPSVPAAGVMCCGPVTPSFNLSPKNAYVIEGDIVQLDVTFNVCVAPDEIRLNGVKVNWTESIFPSGGLYPQKLTLTHVARNREFYDGNRTFQWEVKVWADNVLHTFTYDSASESVCVPGKYGGVADDACPFDCSCVHGNCRNGVAGDGKCLDCDANTGWKGQNCDFCLSSIGPTFSGWQNSSGCDECGGEYYGNDCLLRCDCAPNVTCSTGLEGDGSCNCSANSGLSGPTCSECTGPWAGGAASGCNIPCTCDPEHGVCDNEGAGECAFCFNANRFGSDCAFDCTCLHGVCSNGVAGDGECLRCSDGTGWDGPNCDACGAGFGNVECSTLCPPGHASPYNSTECSPCERGYYADRAGSEECEACSPGSFADLTGRSRCLACGAGTYANFSGAIRCLECPAGKHAPGLASVADDYACEPCVAGAVPSDDKSYCAQCPLGFHTPEPGRSTCLPCPSGTFSGQLGSANCSLCPLGSYQPFPEKSACVLCALGNYSDEAGATACKICPPGTEATTRGMRQCYPCGLGRSKAAGQVACSPCPPGAFNAESDTASSCELCPLGHFAPTVGLPSCLPCPPSSFADVTGLSNCTACPSSAYHNANGATSAGVCTCKRTFFRNAELVCAECPSGGECLGDERPPRAAPGFFISPDDPLLFLACYPAEACINGGCAEGYTGFKCGRCDTGYYLLADECVSCPSNVSWRMIVVIPVLLLGVVALLVFAHQFQKGSKTDITQRRLRLATASIGLNYFQILAIFNKFNLKWPRQVKAVLTFVSLANFNVDLLAAECTVGAPYLAKFMFSVFFPLMVMFALVCLYGATKLLHKLSPKVPDLQPAVLCSTGVTVMLISFVFVVSRAFEPFDCTKNRDGRYTLDAAPSYYCFEGSLWTQIAPVGVMAILFYAVAFPAALSFLLRTKRKEIETPGSLWNAAFGFVVERFTRSRFHWEVITLARKGMIILSMLFFANNPIVQSFLAQIVLVISSSLQQYFWPYRWEGHNRLESFLLFGGLILLFAGQVCFTLQSIQVQDNEVNAEEKASYSDGLVDFFGWMVTLMVVFKTLAIVGLTAFSAYIIPVPKELEEANEEADDDDDDDDHEDHEDHNDDDHDHGHDDHNDDDDIGGNFVPSEESDAGADGAAVPLVSAELSEEPSPPPPPPPGVNPNRAPPERV